MNNLTKASSFISYSIDSAFIDPIIHAMRFGTTVVHLYIGKNGFTEVSEDLIRYTSENNFVWTVKTIMWYVQTYC